MFIRLGLVILSVYVFGHWLAGVSLAVLLFIWWMLPRIEGPPVLALAMTAQWMQASIGVFYMGATGRALKAVEADYQTMVLMSLVSIVTVTVGIAIGLRMLGDRARPRSDAPNDIVDLKTLVVAYAAAVVLTGAIQGVAFEYPRLTQAILAMSFTRLALMALMIRRLMREEQFKWIGALVIFEVVLGFTGFFSDFKEPVLITGMMMLERFEPRRSDHWIVGGVLGVALTVMLVMWMGVRAEYRHDFEEEAFAASRSARLERLQALATDWYVESKGVFGETVDELVDRAWAVYYPALAIQRVPSVLPHTDGRMMTDMMTHLMTPRILFPNKPDLPSDSELVRKYAGIYVAGAEHGTTIAFGYVAESYVDYGIPGMFFPMLIFGILMGTAYGLFQGGIQHRELAVALLVCIFWLNLSQFERSWAKTVGLSITMMGYLGGLAYLLDRWLLIRNAEEAAERHAREESYPAGDHALNETADEPPLLGPAAHR